MNPIQATITLQALAFLLIITGTAIADDACGKPQILKGFKNSDKVIECPIFHADGAKPTLKWWVGHKTDDNFMKIAELKANGQIKYSTKNLSLDGRVKLFPNGSLLIKSLGLHDEGTYQCEIDKPNTPQCDIELEVECNGNVKTTQGRIAKTTATTIQMRKTPPNKTNMVCGGVLMDPVGTFQSPNFPSAYPANSHCKWNISLPQDYAAINVTLKQVNLEGNDVGCLNDYIAIYDELENQIGCRRCGTESSVELQVRGRIAVIVFQTDSSVSKSGFQATYKGVLNVGNR